MQTDNKDTHHPKPPTAFEHLTYDTDRYLAQLDYPELSDAQKQEIFETLWSIMAHFVDSGFGSKSAQLALSVITETSVDCPQCVGLLPNLSRLKSDLA